jgi:hypothetical protein
MHTSLSADLRMPESLVTARVATARLGIGLVQGSLLFLLYHASQHQAWPATEPLLFAPLLLMALLAPLVLVSSLGHMTRRQTLRWVACATILAAALGWYDVWRGADLAAPTASRPPDGPGTGGIPSGPLCVFVVIGLFIAHTLVLAAVRDRRRIAAYSTYFETAWKLAVQLAFSGLFVGATWLVLTLGAQLFMLVKLGFLKDVISEPWFAIPVTAFAFSCAMHLTDVRPAIVRGIRTLLLMLMSWILPVMTLLVGGFLLSLPFTGLAPLWATRHAGSVLLLADALFIVLINAAWQNGETGSTVALLVRLCARAAAVLLVPLTLLAIYALALRVHEYGWTDDRIHAAACLLVASCYAAGYAQAALRRGWLLTIARVNIATAFVVLATLLLVFSPLADPARLSVNDQVDRLLSGKVPPAKFDFAYLRFEGLRFGRAALARLDATASGPNAASIRERIAAARSLQGRPVRTSPELPPQDIAKNVHMWPKGARLPASFVAPSISIDGAVVPACLREAGQPCDAVLLDLTGDGKPEIVLLSATAGPSAVMAEDDKGQWQAIAWLPYETSGCSTLRDALVAGKVRAVPSAMNDIEIGGQRLPLRGRLVKAPECRKK